MEKSVKYIKLLVVTLLLLGSISCNNWLDLEPESKLVKQEFWQKKEDVAAVMAAMYDSYRENAVALWLWGEVRADMVDVSNGSTLSNYQLIAQAEILSTNSVITWSGFYNAINLANTVLLYSKDVLDIDETFDKKTEKAYEAEALFIRAKCYFDLVRIWKDVPLVLSASSTDTVSFSINKSSEAEIINQIEIDLLNAKTTAYTNEYISTPERFKGRANLYAIDALLSDVYLWSEQYEKCIGICDEIINSGLFQLQSSTEWFDLFYPGNATESIFEIQYNCAYIDEYNPLCTTMGISGSGSTSQVSLKTAAKELFTLTDIRKGYTDPRSKYLYKSITTKTKRVYAESDANIIYYRYGDILLAKAEALSELGRFSEANEYINNIRERATLTPMVINSEISTFRSVIMEERCKEFAFEGKRWFDVLRFAKKNHFANKDLIIQMILSGADAKQQAILRSRILDTMSYYLPIPESELKSNPKLVQNPYYDR
jgi:starch-binding outer membrane protein, SusD/RagB family